MKVLGDVTPVFRHFFLEKSQYSGQYVVTHSGRRVKRRNHYNSTADIITATNASHNQTTLNTSRKAIKNKPEAAHEKPAHISDVFLVLSNERVTRLRMPPGDTAMNCEAACQCLAGAVVTSRVKLQSSGRGFDYRSGRHQGI